MFAASTDLEKAVSGLSAVDWLTAGVILIASFVSAGVVRRITARVVADEGGAATAAARLVGRLGAFIVVAAGLLYSLSVLHVRLAPLLGALGIGGLALAFAAQTVLENLFASVLLQVRHPFRHGDQIATCDHEGVVEDVNFRTVVLRTFDGQRVFIPCSEVLGNPIVNHTARGTRRTTLELGIAYEADLEKAQRVVLEAMQGVDGVLKHPVPQVWVESFGESTVDFAAQFWHAPDQASLWRVRSGVAVAVKAALDQAGIAMPFPQRDVHVRADS